jgi:hypothetical protein
LELLLDRPSLGGRTDLMPVRHIPRTENRIHPAVWDWVPLRSRIGPKYPANPIG